MIKQVSFFVLIVFFLVSCSSEDFVQHETGLRYKVITQNKDAKKPQNGDVMELKMRIRTMTDSVVYNDFLRLALGKATHNGGSLDDGFALLHIGDSAHFIIPTDSFYTKTLKQPKAEIDSEKHPNLIFEVKLKNFITAAEIEKEKEVMEKESAALEEQLLMDYIQREGIKTEPTVNGLYFIELEKGNGEKPQPGQEVEVHYKGTLINGQPFDSSYDRDEPIKFKLGVGQVIPGWDEGISMLEEGGKAKLIIPSYLAYGNQQRGPVIKPYSSLVFEVELVKIIK